MATVILVGPPGAGKSTVGKAMAHARGCPFIDTDAVVEKSYGAAISDIFVDKGEDFFRELEFKALQESLQHNDAVLALGGGAPISSQAQAILKSEIDRVIFLDVSLSVAAPRVGFNRDRPLLLSNPRAQWQALAETRRPIYESIAGHTIKVDDMSVEQIVEKIQELLT